MRFNFFARICSPIREDKRTPMNNRFCDSLSIVVKLWMISSLRICELIGSLYYCSTRHHARRSPSTGGCHTHASHSHTSTPGSSPLHAPAGLLSPHRAMPTSHIGQTVSGSPHRLSTGGSTTAASAGNGESPMSQSVPTPAPALTSVGIELNEMQPGEFGLLSRSKNRIIFLILRHR